MGNVGREVCLAGKNILDAGEHLVEGEDELLQLDRHRARFEAGIEVLCGDALDRAAELA